MSTVLPGAGKHLVTAGCLRRWELLYSCGNVRKTRFGKRERIGKFCLALAVRIDHEMEPPYSFGALRHHFGHHPPFADIPFRMQAG